MPIDASYQFVLTPPGDTLVAHMNVDRETPADGGRGRARARRHVDLVAARVVRGGDSLGAAFAFR